MEIMLGTVEKKERNRVGLPPIYLAYRLIYEGNRLAVFQYFQFFEIP